MNYVCQNIYAFIGSEHSAESFYENFNSLKPFIFVFFFSFFAVKNDRIMQKQQVSEIDKQ